MPKHRSAPEGQIEQVVTPSRNLAAVAAYGEAAAGGADKGRWPSRPARHPSADPQFGGKAPPPTRSGNPHHPGGPGPRFPAYWKDGGVSEPRPRALASAGGCGLPERARGRRLGRTLVRVSGRASSPSTRNLPSRKGSFNSPRSRKAAKNTKEVT